MTEAIQVVTTTDNEEDALRIAGALIERRLAGCVQVSGPITSVYRWEGKVETSAEWTCRAKTCRSHYEALEAAIRELHAYDVPEILAVPVVAGGQDYLEWLRGELVDLPDGE